MFLEEKSVYFGNSEIWKSGNTEMLRNDGQWRAATAAAAPTGKFSDSWLSCASSVTLAASVAASRALRAPPLGPFTLTWCGGLPQNLGENGFLPQARATRTKQGGLQATTPCGGPAEFGAARGHGFLPGRHRYPPYHPHAPLDRDNTGPIRPTPRCHAPYLADHPAHSLPPPKWCGTYHGV